MTEFNKQLLKDSSLEDRYDLSKDEVLLNGTQALIRFLLIQKQRDLKAGLNTAGYVSGYRGAPLGNLDFLLGREKSRLDQSDIVFNPGLNEDIAATALWGTQQAELRGEGKFDGVYGLWYGKGPGVDRSCDVLRHANMAGTSKYGGVMMALGDDHTGESSTTLHQSDMALLDLYMPIFSPAGVQEVLDYGVYGIALSRFSGNWVGLKCMKETIESTAVVDGNPFRIDYEIPHFDIPEGGLNIRIWDTPGEREARILDYRRYAAEAFAYQNNINHRVAGKPGAKIGIAAAGKNWFDLIHALSLLGLDDQELERLGITTYKIGLTWPLDQKGMLEWAEGLDTIIVVEEKRKLIEAQIKELLFNQRKSYQVFGHRDHKGEILFTAKYGLSPIQVAIGIGEVLGYKELQTERLLANLQILKDSTREENAPDILKRSPYFCSGCPHNTSTKIPEGSRAYAGIGCHYMVQWMDRETLGFTHMGGEGANWIGEAPFSNTPHIFQNMGDGTYNHSGVQTIRAAVVSGVNMTYKILYNDAVAMTGGQLNDGDLTPQKVIRELVAIGVGNVAVVYDEKEDFDKRGLPDQVKLYPREKLDEVQRQFRELPGVSAIVYIQTCAAEKRRRRKRGSFPKISERVYINTDVCEGCGDCGVQSNCVSLVPVETKLGRKRAVDQSSCNMDLSCVKGFCPSFVTLEGAEPRREKTRHIDIPDLIEPEIPSIDKTYNIVITGVGGTGVVTIGALLAQASYLENKGVGVIEMAGLAQKGGAVTIHCRIANKKEDISAIRVANNEADCVIGGDLVVTAVSDILRVMKPDKTRVALNSFEIITGDFTRDTNFTIPSESLVQRIVAKLGPSSVQIVNANTLATALLGNSIYSNIILLGIAWQNGTIPLGKEAILRAIELNGVNIKENIQAFEIGRWASTENDLLNKLGSNNSNTGESVKIDPIEFRRKHLIEFQGSSLANDYISVINEFQNPLLKEAVAKSYHKLLAVKDEYEVARLHLKTADKVSKEFTGDFKIKFHLAPPLISKAVNGARPPKYQFGSWMIHFFRLLAAVKGVRGTIFDPFRFGEERKLQGKLKQDYLDDLDKIRKLDSPDMDPEVLELAEIPQQVGGYGPVWKANYISAMKRREELHALIESLLVEGITNSKNS
ncbi:MAG: indolepyruvate ferredoxin oxidoreductase family protein [Rhodobacteraceae bacterium]|nr:indolepyruvate ferredoxin oxidoreductase family protein [Paracoccaceae bacterium]MYI90797.1 indolepyruvate ferredoxin oxidoreductase family protein [Paracoccaceae bacterium]